MKGASRPASSGLLVAERRRAALVAIAAILVLSLETDARPSQAPLSTWASRRPHLSAAAVKCIDQHAHGSLRSRLDGVGATALEHDGLAALAAADRQVVGDAIVGCVLAAGDR